MGDVIALFRIQSHGVAGIYRDTTRSSVPLRLPVSRGAHSTSDTPIHEAVVGRPPCCGSGTLKEAQCWGTLSADCLGRSCTLSNRATASAFCLSTDTHVIGFLRLLRMADHGVVSASI